MFLSILSILATLERGHQPDRYRCWELLGVGILSKPMVLPWLLINLSGLWVTFLSSAKCSSCFLVATCRRSFRLIIHEHHDSIIIWLEHVWCFGCLLVDVLCWSLINQAFQIWFHYHLHGLADASCVSGVFSSTCWKSWEIVCSALATSKCLVLWREMSLFGRPLLVQLI